MTIIFAGRLIHVKNLKRLITAFSHIQSKAARLKIIGDGPLEANIQHWAQKDSRIFVAGPLPRKELLDEIKKSDFLILPSLTEMFPHVVLEALNSQKPVVMTKETGLPESIKQYVYLVNPLSVEDISNGIRHYLDNSNYQQAVSQLRHFQPTFGWPEIVQKHFEFFKQV